MDYPKEVIIAYIEKYITDDWSLQENRSWINIDSPFTRDDNKRCGFNYESQFVHDFKLGEKWSIEGFVAEHQNISLPQARALLFRIILDLKNNKNTTFSVITKSTKRKIEEAVPLEKIKKDLVPPSLDFTCTYSDHYRKALKFLKKKNISIEHIKKFNLSFIDQKRCWLCDGEDEDCPVCQGKGYNPYYGRIVIPTYENNKLVYFQARDFLDRDLRYFNPKNIEKKYVVSFYDLLKENDRIVLTEGPFDAMTFVNYCSTSMMGSSISDSQVFKLLQKKPKELVMVPDYDPKKETRQRIMRQLDANIKKIVNLSDNKISILVYEWYKMPDIKFRLIEQEKRPDQFESIFKDVNDFNVSDINEKYLIDVTNVYSKLKTRLREIK